jgi:hypothetical protein
MLKSLYTNKERKGINMESYTIWELNQKAEWLPADGKSFSKVGHFLARDSFAAIDQAAVEGYNVKVGDEIVLRNGFTITIKMGD